MIIGRVLIAVLMHHGAQALYYAVRRRQAILEGVDNQLGAQMVGARSADDRARVGVEHDARKLKPGRHAARPITGGISVGLSGVAGSPAVSRAAFDGAGVR